MGNTIVYAVQPVACDAYVIEVLTTMSKIDGLDAKNSSKSTGSEGTVAGHVPL